MKSILEMAGGKRLHDLDKEELEPILEQIRQNIDSWQEEPEVEMVHQTDEYLRALSPEDLLDHLELLQERVEFDEKRKELDKRAIKLGFLKLANQAPRCSQLKSNGEPCQAPALGGRLFCVFHGRALETDDHPRMKVEVLEDRESMQLTLKQIMERIVAGSIQPQHAALLLRAVRIADSALRSHHFFDQPKQRKQISRQGNAGEAWGNAEGNSA
jgi:uncharacterized protein YhaN